MGSSSARVAAAAAGGGAAAAASEAFSAGGFLLESAQETRGGRWRSRRERRGRWRGSILWVMAGRAARAERCRRIPNPLTSSQGESTRGQHRRGGHSEPAWGRVEDWGRSAWGGFTPRWLLDWEAATSARAASVFASTQHRTPRCRASTLSSDGAGDAVWHTAPASPALRRARSRASMLLFCVLTYSPVVVCR